ncbi:hypothetical protein KAI92_03545 [Candidatus Parcubacteria bacterium]|nr:hypothetical protein [Candidatus Parcubacteria bacterium]
MERKRLKKIMDNNDLDMYDLGIYGLNTHSKNAVPLGLKIITKYLPEHDTETADDTVYSVNTDELLEAGVTEDDAVTLSDLNWKMDEDTNCITHSV